MKPGEGIGRYYSMPSIQQEALSRKDLSTIKADLEHVFEMTPANNEIGITKDVYEMVSAAEEVVFGKAHADNGLTITASNPYDVFEDPTPTGLLEPGMSTLLAVNADMIEDEHRVPEIATHIIQARTSATGDPKHPKSGGWRQKTIYFLAQCDTERPIVDAATAHYAFVTNGQESSFIAIAPNKNFGQIVPQRGRVDGDQPERILHKEGPFDTRRFVATPIEHDDDLYDQLFDEFQNGTTQLLAQARIDAEQTQ